MFLNIIMQAVLIINEIAASNIDGTMSPATNYDSWIEIYNPTTEDQVLGGGYLSNDTNNPTLWRLPDNIGSVPAKGFKVLWLGSNESNASQAPFKLSCDGGTVILSNAQGQKIASQNYPAALSRTAWARQTDGTGAWGWTAHPTPGASNASSEFAVTRLDAPEVSAGSRTFTTSFNFHVTIPEGCTLYYTTDGSLPTEKSLTSKSGRFYVNESINYRFRLYRQGYLPSVPVTRSYIMTEPTSLPIVSVVGDERYFTDPQIGIAVKGTNGIAGHGRNEQCNWNQDWERPVNFSYILPDKPAAEQMAFNQDVAISVSGAATRYDEPKSFKLKSGKEFDGQNTLPYPFFEQKPTIRNKTVVLRNGGNDNVDGSGGSQYKAGRFRDAAIQTVLLNSGIDIDAQAYQPVVRYINGKRDGVINLREPNNKKYAAANYGYDDENIDFIEENIYHNLMITEGSGETLERIFELAKDARYTASYKEIKTLLDIDEYINYMAAQLYLCSKDWPHNNMKAFRSKDNGRFRFIIFDLDLILRVNDPFQTFADEQWYQFSTETGGKQPQKEEIRLVTLFLNLLQNEEFRRQFIDTYTIMAGSIFDEKKTEDIIRSLADRVRGEMQKDGMTPDGAVNFLMNGLRGHGDKMMACLRRFEPMKLNDTEHFNIQLSANVPGARLCINKTEVPGATFQGEVIYPVQLHADAPAGYRFAGWKINDQEGYISTRVNYNIATTSGHHYKACFEPLSQQERLAQGITPVCVNEVSAANDMAVNDLWKRADWVELYNTTDADIDIAGMYMSDDVDNPQKWQIEADDNISTVVPAHGYLTVWCDKNEPLSQLHTPFKLAAEGGIVSLTAADNSWCNILSYGQHSSYESVGRFPDGMAEVYQFSQPTIANRNRLSSYAAAVEQPDLTGIVEMPAAPAVKDDRYFNLNGQRVQPGSRGIIIHNGRKLVRNHR